MRAQAGVVFSVLLMALAMSPLLAMPAQHNEIEIFPDNASFGANLRIATGVWGTVLSITPAYSNLPAPTALDKHSQPLYPLGCVIRSATAGFYIRETTGWSEWPEASVHTVVTETMSVGADEIFSVTKGRFSARYSEWKHILPDHYRLGDTWRPYVEIGDVVYDRFLNFEPYEGNPLAIRALYVRLYDGYNWEKNQRFFSFFTIESVTAVTILQGYGMGRGQHLRLPLHPALISFNPRLTMGPPSYLPFQIATRWQLPIKPKDTITVSDGYLLWDTDYVALALYDDDQWKQAILGYMTYQPDLPGTDGLLIWDPFEKRKFLYDGSVWRVVVTGYGDSPASVPATLVEGLWLYTDGTAYVWNGSEWIIVIEGV